MDGLSFIPVVIGLFGIAEILQNIERRDRKVFTTQFGSVLPSRHELRQSSAPIARGGLIGFVLGIIPGATSVIASYLSYGTEVRRAKDPTRFGKGAIEGVAGPETANNSFVNANFIPLLALGIPGTASMAMIMGGMMANGLVPGPRLFIEQSEFVWTLIASMMVGNVILLLLNLPLIRVWVLLLKVPYAILFAIILLFTIVGAYAVSYSPFNLLVMSLAGLAGYLLNKLDYPLAPLVLTLIIGPLMEENLRRSLQMSQGSFAIFTARPLAFAGLCLAAAILVWPLIRGRMFPNRRGMPENTTVALPNENQGDQHVKVPNNVDGSGNTSDGGGRP